MSTLRIQAFSFLEFMQLVQDAVVQGYRMDFDSNDNCPQRFGNTYECGMIKMYADSGPTQEQIKALEALSALGQEIDSELFTGTETEVKPKVGRPKKGTT
jgi:hypothetical protein